MITKNYLEQKKIIWQDQEIVYKLKRSAKAKRMRLAVHCDASVVVMAPVKMEERVIDKFLVEKIGWLISKIEYFKNNQPLLPVKSTRRDYLINKRPAFKFVRERVAVFNQFYQFSFNKIIIKNQKTMWGSCSRKGNLNYNYKLVLLPQHLADYVVVHELCHLKEFNHSKRFWNLVAQVMPNYLELRRELKKGVAR